MGRKNRRRGGRELSQDVIKDILTDNKQELGGMRIEHVMVCEHFEPPKESEADKACHRAGIVCDRIIAELDNELGRA